VLWVILAITLSISAGFEAERRAGERASALARRLLKTLLFCVSPPVAFVNIVHLEITPDVGGGIVVGWGALVLAGLAAWGIARYTLRLDDGATGVLVNTSLQGNTGYLGMPLCAALLGSDHLSQAIAYDSFVQAPVLLLGVFGVSAALGSATPGTADARVRAFVLKNPVLLAVIAGLLAPAALAPQALVDVSHTLVFAALPVGFFSAGVILAEQAAPGGEGAGRRPAFEPRIGAAVALRLVLAPLLLLALAAPFVNLPPAYLLLAAMPSGINGLTVAHAFGLDLRFAASSIAWTTAIAIAGYTALALVA
jgi:predicted permease